MIGWLILLGLFAFFIYYGYHLVVSRSPGKEGGSGRVSQCHLCRKSFPEREMVAREKMAGFVNYFCSDCIEKLYQDLREQTR